MKPEPSLFRVRANLVIDLNEIAWIKEDTYVRMKGMPSSLEVYGEEAKKILAAWIAYKGIFDPAKER